jgi:hypothetical protein
MGVVGDNAMKAFEFRDWLKGLSKLSHKQRSELAHELHTHKPASEVVALLEQGGMLTACIHCK